MNNPLPANFPGDTRIHIALSVTKLEQSRRFYETLLDVPPAKERPGYVKFEPRNPSINLTLQEVPQGRRRDQPAHHYGIQVKTTAAVQDAIARFSNAGLVTHAEHNTTCCYAVQDKVWVADPDGRQWEIFVVLDSDAGDRNDDASRCCGPRSMEASATTCC